jgi:hypothetical protein
VTQFKYRKGRMIQTRMNYNDTLCYMSQYYDHRTATGAQIWIDLCCDTGEHIFGYTLFGICGKGIELCDIDFTDNLHLPSSKIRIDGDDEYL